MKEYTTIREIDVELATHLLHQGRQLILLNDTDATFLTGTSKTQELPQADRYYAVCVDLLAILKEANNVR